MEKGTPKETEALPFLLVIIFSYPAVIERSETLVQGNKHEL